MQTRLSLMLAGMLLLSQASMAQTTETLTLSAKVPAASGLSLDIHQGSRSPASGIKAAAVIISTTSCPFGALTYDPNNHIFTTDTYFFIDISESPATGTPIVNITYTEGDNPNGARGGLGTKATAAFVTTRLGSGTSTVDTPVFKKKLSELIGTAGELTHIPSGSWERVYVSICNGSTNDAPNCNLFTSADAWGPYSGTLTFTTVSL